MPQDEETIERKGGAELDSQVKDRREADEDVHQVIPEEAFEGVKHHRRPLRRAASSRGVVAEPQPFRFFGTRIQEAVRVFKG